MARQRTIALRCALATLVALVAIVSSAVAGHSIARKHAVAAQADRMIVGIVSGAAGWGDSALAGRLRQVVSQTGARWLREGFYWDWIEPRPRVFRFAHYDHLMLLAARRHEHVVALLNTAPRWAAPTPISVPRNPSAYAAFVAAVVHRYGPNGTFWRRHPQLRTSAITTFDLWNEPYYDNGNNGDYDPGRYARLVKAAGMAGHAADPNAKFLMAAEMQSALIHSNWIWWVDSLYRAVPDLNNYFDGVSVHPYGSNITGHSPAIRGKPYYGYEQMRRIELIRKQFVAHGAASKPFWATEVGWPTCTSGSNRCVSAAGQLASLNALLHYSQTIWKGWIRAAFIYYYDDRGSSANPDDDYGLTYSNHRPKPALSVFTAAARLSPSVGWVP